MLGTAGRIRPGPGLLEEFVRLEGQPCQSFYKYARRRGVLGICKHDLPSTHSPRARISVSFPRSPFGCSPRPVSRSAGQSTSVKDLEFWDPLAAWRRFSTEAGALLRLVEALQSEKSTDPSDWQALYRHDPFVRSTGRPIPWWTPPRPTDRFECELVASKINDWLEIGNVRPALVWLRDRQVVFSGSGTQSRTGATLFGSLSIQLLMLATRTTGLAVCSGCGTPYVPKRRPRSDQRCYCHRCRADGVPQRDAKRDERKREPKRKRKRH